MKRLVPSSVNQASLVGAGNGKIEVALDWWEKYGEKVKRMSSWRNVKGSLDTVESLVGRMQSNLLGRYRSEVLGD